MGPPEEEPEPQGPVPQFIIADAPVEEILNPEEAAEILQQIEPAEESVAEPEPEVEEEPAAEPEPEAEEDGQAGAWDMPFAVAVAAAAFLTGGAAVYHIRSKH